MTTHFEPLSFITETLDSIKGANQDAVSFLKSQHREVEALFAKIEKLESGAVQTRAKLLNELIHKIEGHALIEEKILYPAGKSVDKDMTLEAVEEHGMVKDMIAKLQQIKPADETFPAKVTVLKELIEHHVKEEENEYFPELKNELGDERLTELGAQLQQAFDQYESRSNAVKLPAKRAAATKKASKPRAPAKRPATKAASKTVRTKTKPKAASKAKGKAVASKAKAGRPSGAKGRSR